MKQKINLLFYTSFMYYYGMIPIFEKQKEQQRRAEMYVTLEDDKQYRD